MFSHWTLVEPKATMPTRSEDTGRRLKALSLASNWSSAKLVELYVALVVHRELP